jgi:hypothetical protein
MSRTTTHDHDVSGHVALPFRVHHKKEIDWMDGRKGARRTMAHAQDFFALIHVEIFGGDDFDFEHVGVLHDLQVVSSATATASAVVVVVRHVVLLMIFYKFVLF